MPEYPLRNVDPDLWSRFTERAEREQWPVRAVLIALMEAYASGDYTPAGSSELRQMQEWGWLLAHYRSIAEQPDFTNLGMPERWERLVLHVINSPAAEQWQRLEVIPLGKRGQILNWLTKTSRRDMSPHGLTLRAIAHIGEGPDLTKNRRPFQFEVLGLPPGQQAWIADYDGGWRILRVIHGQQGHWGERHLTKEDALNMLAEMVAKSD